MRRSWLRIMGLVLGVLLAWSSSALPQGDPETTRMLLDSYDFLEAGQLAEAKAIFRDILQRDPGNPLALNNLAAVMVKEKKYQEALKYLEQALTRARGYKVKVNRMCAVDGLCLAFRPLQEVYGNQDLEPLVKLNIDMVKARHATRQ
jgi:tetratricopeptide (TPR) repeat protein